MGPGESSPPQHPPRAPAPPCERARPAPPPLPGAGGTGDDGTAAVGRVRRRRVASCGQPGVAGAPPAFLRVPLPLGGAERSAAFSGRPLLPVGLAGLCPPRSCLLPLPPESGSQENSPVSRDLGTTRGGKTAVCPRGGRGGEGSKHMIKKRSAGAAASGSRGARGCGAGGPGLCPGSAARRERGADRALLCVSAGFIQRRESRKLQKLGDPAVSQAKWVCRRRMKKEIA